MAVKGDQLERGSVVGGYRIDELIGRGGMGLVYRATNVALNRIYALKVLAPGLAEDEQFRQRVKREMRLKQGSMEPNRAVDLLEQFASALDAAHRRGLVHRDVKPANILITVKD